MSPSRKLPPFVDPRHEPAYWEARAKIMWGQSRDDVRDWLEGHPIRPADIEAILDACVLERARVMRAKGIRDLLVAGGLLAAGSLLIALQLGFFFFFDSGLLLIVYSFFHLSRGTGRLLHGARARGTVTDSADSEIGL